MKDDCYKLYSDNEILDHHHNNMIDNGKHKSPSREKLNNKYNTLLFNNEKVSVKSKNDVGKTNKKK